MTPRATGSLRQSSRAPSRWLPVRGQIAPGLSRLFGLLSALLLLVAYAFLSHRPWVSAALLPTLSSIAQAGYEALSKPEFWLDVQVSFLRVTAGFLAKDAISTFDAELRLACERMVDVEGGIWGRVVTASEALVEFEGFGNAQPSA